MSNLIIPNKINAHKPKINKTQMMEALMLAAKEKHDKEKEGHEKELEKLQKELDALVIKSLKNKKIEIVSAVIPYGVLNGWSKEYEVNVITSAPINYKSNEVTKLIKKCQIAHKKTCWDENEVKEKIKKSLRVPNPLLQPSFKKALNDTLTQILEGEVTHTIDA